MCNSCARPPVVQIHLNARCLSNAVHFRHSSFRPILYSYSKQIRTGGNVYVASALSSGPHHSSFGKVAVSAIGATLLLVAPPRLLRGSHPAPLPARFGGTQPLLCKSFFCRAG